LSSFFATHSGSGRFIPKRKELELFLVFFSYLFSLNIIQVGWHLNAEHLYLFKTVTGDRNRANFKTLFYNASQPSALCLLCELCSFIFI
jgi:hypothetical protein